MVVLRKTKSGSYILSELDGLISKLCFAAFRLVPYHPRNLQVVPVTKITNATSQQLNDYIYDLNIGDPDFESHLLQTPPTNSSSLVQLNGRLLEN